MVEAAEKWGTREQENDVVGEKERKMNVGEGAGCKVVGKR